MKELILYTTNNDKLVTYEDQSAKLVAIKPICELMGINYPSQFTKVKSHYLLSSTVVLSTTTGSDNKQYEMQCLPMLFAIIWVGSINAENTKNPDKVKQVQLQVIQSLYNSIEEPRQYMAEKEIKIRKLSEKQRAAKLDFSTAKSKLQEISAALYEVTDMTIEDWREENKQLELKLEE